MKIKQHFLFGLYSENRNISWKKKTHLPSIQNLKEVTGELYKK